MFYLHGLRQALSFQIVINYNEEHLVWSNNLKWIQGISLFRTEAKDDRIMKYSLFTWGGHLRKYSCTKMSSVQRLNKI